MSQPHGANRGTQLPDTTLLAAARTVMANERTTLAFVKTGLGLLLTGAGLLKLYQHPVLQAAGWVALASALLVAAGGFLRYWRIRRHIGDRRSLQKLAKMLNEERISPQDDGK